MFCIAVLAGSFAAANANACVVFSSHLRILFDEIPFGLEVPVIARITGVGVLPGASNGAVVLARIDKVIKGELDGEFVRLAYVLTSCGPAAPEHYVGASGIVLGTLARNDEGALILRPTYDSDNQLWQREREQNRGECAD